MKDYRAIEIMNDAIIMQPNEKLKKQWSDELNTWQND